MLKHGMATSANLDNAALQSYPVQVWAHEMRCDSDCSSEQLKQDQHQHQRIIIHADELHTLCQKMQTRSTTVLQ